MTDSSKINPLQKYSGEDSNHFANRLMLDRVVKVLDSLSDRTNALKTTFEKATKTQDKQQNVTVWLTVALVVCTVLYTVITGYSAKLTSDVVAVSKEQVAVAKEQVAAAREANDLQRQVVEMAKQVPKKTLTKK